MKNKIFSMALVSGVLLTCMPVDALTKEETVYSKLNIDGSLKSTVVSEHIINDGTNVIEDKTNLSEVVNTNGKEELNQNGNQLIIKSNGNDIYYQGISTEKLPISTNITYELDGNKIELKDLLGKQGKVKMIISFTNNDSHIVNGNTLYTPFVVVTTLSLDNKNNSNITVSNGKVISTGSKSMIAAISSPGLDKSLELDELKSLNKVEITFDTKKYESTSFYIVATPKILESDDLNIFDNLNKLFDSSAELSKASLDIQKGAEQLSTGINTINDYSSQLANSVKTLNQYIDTAQQGSIKLDNAVKLILETIKEKSVSLTTENNAEKLQTISTLIETNKTAINSLSTSNNTLVNSTQTLEQVYLSSYPLYDKDGNAILENGTPKMGTLKDFDEETILVLAGVLGNEQIVTIKKQYESNINLINLLSANNIALEQCLTTLKSTEKEIGTTLSTLIDALTELSNGTNELVTGLSQISAGTSELSNKTDEFSSGVKALAVGAEELSKGTKDFNEYGLNKITKFINQDLKNYQSKIESLISLSNNYETFTMKTDDMDGSTKFIMQVDKLKEVTKDTTKEETVVKKSLWQKIKDLF